MATVNRSRRLLSAITSSTPSSTLLSSVAPPPPVDPDDPTVAISNESNVVVLIAALLCAAICLIGLLAVVRCACFRRPNTAPKAANKGLKKKILHSLPKFILDGTTRSKFGSDDCAICLTEFVDGDEIRLLPQCGHGFHVGCVDTWLGAHSSCPSCRMILVTVTSAGTSSSSRCCKCGRSTDEAQRKAREDAAASASASASAAGPSIVH